MQTSTTETPKVRDPRSILLLGPPGGGKSALAMQFPSPCFYDIDRNLDGAEAFIRKKLPSLDYSYERCTFYEDGKPIPAEDVYDNVCRLIAKTGNSAKTKTNVIDSLNLLSDFIIAKILFLQKAELMQPHFYDAVKAYLRQILVTRLRSTGVTSIVTCHETIIEKNTDPKKPMQSEIVRYEPMVPGKIKDALGGYFTDVWRCTCGPSTQPGTPHGSLSYRLQTRKDSKSELKCSIPEMPSVIEWQSGELGFAKIEPFLKGWL